MIEIYSKEDCAGCIIAKNILNEKNIPFNEIAITPDTIEQNSLTCAPTFFIGENRLDGYPGMDKLLKFVEEYEQEKDSNA